MTALGKKALPPASVLGIGAVTSLGRDLHHIAMRLSAPIEGNATPRVVSNEQLSDSRAGGRLRRADRFTRMAVLAALDAMENARNAFGDPTDPVGLILATGLGPHVRTFRFLDGILDFGDDSALPTDFSHSVHNAAAAYITEIMSLRGRSCTIADFEMGFEQAVLLAQCWLAEGCCTRVLVGAAEELGEIMLSAVPRALCNVAVTPGEGAVFFALGPGGRAGCPQIDAAATPASADLLIMDELTVVSAAAPTCAPTVETRQTISFTPYFGHSAGSSAFQALGGVLSLRQRSALGRFLHGEIGRAVVDTAVTFKRLYSGRAAVLFLANSGI